MPAAENKMRRGGCTVRRLQKLSIESGEPRPEIMLKQEWSVDSQLPKHVLRESRSTHPLMKILISEKCHACIRAASRAYEAAESLPSAVLAARILNLRKALKTQAFSQQDRMIHSVVHSVHPLLQVVALLQLSTTCSGVMAVYFERSVAFSHSKS